MTANQRRRIPSVATILAAVVLLMAIIAVVGLYKEETFTFTYKFYNDTAPEAHKNYNSGDVLDPEFESGILAAAPADVRENPSAHVDWFRNNLYGRIYDHAESSGDPVLLTQHALDAELRAPKTVGGRLLPETERSVESYRGIVLRLISDKGAHIDAAGKLQAVWNSATKVTVQKITAGYTSMGFQRRDGIALDEALATKLGRKAIPMPVLEETRGVDGWEISFHYENGEKLSYRINCGYQPDSSNYAKAPAPVKKPAYKPPVITIEEPEPTPEPEETPAKRTPRPARTPEPTENPPTVSIEIADPTPTPRWFPPARYDPPPTTTQVTPEPKPIDGGPNGQDPDNPYRGGPANVDNDIELREEEPRSPDSHTPPTQPVPQAGDDRFDTPADTAGGSVADTDAGKIETITVDTDGDGEEDDGSVSGTVAEGQNDHHTDTLDDVQQDPANNIEPGLNADNSFEILAPDLEMPRSEEPKSEE